MMIVSSDDWGLFRHDVKNDRRYFFSASILDKAETNSDFISNEDFLGWLLTTLVTRKRFLELEKGMTLWRAQLGGEPYEPKPATCIEDDGTETLLYPSRKTLRPHGRDRMIPYRDKAQEGRINPKGIPCLYTATDGNTAMTEMKPKIGSYLTLAEFITVKELKIVDFASEPIQLIDPEDGPTDEDMESIVWEDIGDLFSETVTDSDDIADYASTQIVAELFRRAGFDGIRYKSKLTEFESLEPLGSLDRNQEFRAATRKEGRNIAMFDPACADFRSSSLYRFAVTEHGCFDFRKVNNSVYCADQIPEGR